MPRVARFTQRQSDHVNHRPRPPRQPSTGVGHDDGDFLTIEREDLCDYIDEAISATGVDLDALAERRGIGRADLTDKWREW
jgi:hypothetical protein